MQAGPPKDLGPSKLWAELSAQPRPHAIVEFPRPKADGTYGMVAIWVMTQAENMAAQRDAEGVVRKLMRDSGGIPKMEEAAYGYQSMFNNEAAVQILRRVLRDPDDLSKPMFYRAEELRELTTDEVGVLMNLYNQTQASVGPIVSMMTDETYLMWVEILAKGADTAPFVLARISSGLKNDLMMRLAGDLWNFQTGSTSSGQEPESIASDSRSDDPDMLEALILESEP